MGKYSKEHNEFFDAIKDIGSEVGKTISNPSFRSVMQSAKLARNPISTTTAVLVRELSKEGSVEISNDINPIKLKNFLVDNYKIDWLDWLPEVTDKTVFGNQEAEALSNKIQAIRTCLTTDTPWLEWHIFENVGTAFNHQIPDFNRVQPLTLAECITTMDTMMKLRSDEDFSEEVLSYVASIAANENFVYLPEDLHVGQANTILRKMTKDFNSFAFVEMVVYRWGQLKDRDLLNNKFLEDSKVHRQLAKLALAQQYYKEFLE